MTSETGPGAGKPRRRPRYPGRNPRRFEDRYKEREPERFPETAAKVVASGKTLAGTHRPVLVAEVLDALRPAPGEVGVDATLGFGGHAEAILPRLLPGGRLVALDVDPIERPRAEARLRGKGFGPEVLSVRSSNFAGLPKVLAAEGLEGADVVLADLGVSSMQLDDPARGFSWKGDGPLDLRLNPTRGASARDLLARVSARRLERLLRENADEPHAELIARAVVAARQTAPIETTAALAGLIRGALAALPERALLEAGTSTLSRVFQALRIEVNEELLALDAFLRALPSCLRAGGRAAVISFHSGEDRRVKRAFRDGLRCGVYREVAPGPVVASEEERRANPRAAPAKLRWAVKA